MLVERLLTLPALRLWPGDEENRTVEFFRDCLTFSSDSFVVIPS